MTCELAGHKDQAQQIADALARIGLAPVRVSVCGRNVIASFHGQGSAWRAVDVLHHMGRCRVYQSAATDHWSCGVVVA